MRVILYLISCSFLFISCEWSSEEPFQSRQILEGYHVTAIDFDGNGNAWLGTLNQGLIRFDGQRETIFTEITSLIWALKVDSKNQVYMATAEGLIKFDGEYFTRYDNNPLMKGNVMALDIDSKDRVWFAVGGFKSGGLGKLDGDVLSIYTPDNSPLPAHWVSAVKVGSHDEVWLSAQSSVGSLHLAKIVEEDWVLYDSGNLGFKPYNISNLDENSKGELIGGIDYSLSSTYDPGRPPLFTFNEQEGRQIKSDRPFFLNYIFVDRSDRIWCAGSSGYALYENENWFFDEETFREISIFSIAQASDGAIWLGTGDGIYLSE
jgi:ligand-binding sensor domain-containing protein